MLASIIRNKELFQFFLGRNDTQENTEKHPCSYRHVPGSPNFYHCSIAYSLGSKSKDVLGLSYISQQFSSNLTKFNDGFNETNYVS